MAALSLAVEFSAPLVLLNPRVARWWCVAAWSFHAGVLVLMAIMFHYPISGVAYASFFPVEALHDRWRRSRAARGRGHADADEAAAST